MVSIVPVGSPPGDFEICANPPLGSPSGTKRTAASQKALTFQNPVPEAQASKPVTGGRVQRQRSQNQWKPEDKRRAELEACDQGAVQGKRIRVLQVATLPKPES
jgi:hypothetical protein